MKRSCSRPTCNCPAVASLTYDYSEATVVLGPLPMHREPHAYELCDQHVNSFTAPRGWQVIRLATNFEPAPPSPDDLLALADAVREAGSRPQIGRASKPQQPPARPKFRIVEGG